MRFNGEIAASRRAPQFAVDILRFAPSQNVARHSHPEACIGVLLSGACEEAWDGKRSEYTDGTGVFHPADENHAYRFAPRAQTNMLAICIPAQTGQRLAVYGLELWKPHEKSNSLIAYLGHRLAHFIKQADSSALIIEGLAFELLGELLCTKQRQPSQRIPLDKVIALLHDRFRERISLGSVARELDLDPVALARDFRRSYEMSVGEYVRTLRIDYACDRLAHSCMPLADLACEIGFVDHSHFCHTFKAKVGVTPGAFRKAQRER